MFQTENGDSDCQFAKQGTIGFERLAQPTYGNRKRRTDSSNSPVTVTKKDTTSSPRRLVARTWYSPRSPRCASEILSPEERSVLLTS